MVDSGHPNGDARLVKMTRAAMRRAGFPEETTSQVTTALLAVPEDLITLQEASDKYRRAYDTIARWVQRGHLTEYGRQRFPARGGGKVLISEAELVELLQNPPKAGRPSKNGQ